MHQLNEDILLIREILSGDKNSFRLLYNKYGKFLLKDTEDLVEHKLDAANDMGNRYFITGKPIIVEGVEQENVLLFRNDWFF